MYLSFLSCLLLGDGTLAQTGACPVLWRESRAVVNRVGKKFPWENFGNSSTPKFKKPGNLSDPGTLETPMVLSLL